MTRNPMTLAIPSATMLRQLLLAMAVISVTPEALADDEVDIKASQDVLPPIAQFARCFGTITRTRLPKNHRLYDSVKSGTMSPSDACLAVLHSANLRTDKNPPRGFIENDTDEAKAVIGTFQDFHRTWFAADNFVASIPIGEIYPFSRLITDQAQAAMYVTRALFRPETSYASIVTDRSGIFVYRSPYQVEVGFAAQPAPGQIPFFGYVTTANVPTPIQPPFLIGRGEITGIDLFSEFPNISNFAITNAFQAPVPSFPLYGHYDGGILGNQAYLQLNFGRGEEPNDGGVKVPRRWSKAVLNDLLCRDLPAIRSEDAAPYVQPKSQYSFNQAQGCVQCHATMDNMAGTARNLRYYGLHFPNMSFSMHMVSLPINNASYANQPPAGKLLFRSYDGTLVNNDVMGIQGLGQAIAATNDLYVCAASRYVEFFTGLKVSLQDIGDPTQPKLGGGDLAYRDLVIKWGLEFKDHKSIGRLIETILKSDLYNKQGMRDIVTVE